MPKAHSLCLRTKHLESRERLLLAIQVIVIFEKAAIIDRWVSAGEYSNSTRAERWSAERITLAAARRMRRLNVSRAVRRALRKIELYRCRSRELSSRTRRYLWENNVSWMRCVFAWERLSGRRSMCCEGIGAPEIMASSAAWRSGCG